MKGCLLSILAFCFCIGCTSVSPKHVVQVNHLNDLSYKYRYIDIDSALFYANQAYQLSVSYSEGRAEAIINRAFVAYQQMNYDVALHMLNEVKSTTRNQFNLLCANVLIMKIAQRIGQGDTFFSSRNAAIRILDRINDSKELIDARHERIVNYANSELHIVSSTYYYYLSHDSAAIYEIDKAHDIIQAANDTAQWLNYYYMKGSGGLIKGDSFDVLREEFDYLFRTYTLSAQEGYVYFEANALQSLASMLSDSSNYSYLRNLRGTSFDILYQRHLSWGAESSLPIALARHSISLFQNSKDLFQTACAHRTLGEVYFKNKDFTRAHKIFLNALALVETQKRRSSYSVIPWMASIREKLSLTYSALGQWELAEQNRAVYLELLDMFRQNYESETRLNELTHEVQSVRFKILVLIFLIFITILLLFLFLSRMNSRVRNKTQNLIGYFDDHEYKVLQDQFQLITDNLSERIDDLQDSISVSRLHLNTYKSENVERRAKVSLVYSIIPYLERMIVEVKRMSTQGKPEFERLQYVHELSAEIMKINDALTDWIKMSQGRLKLHITTFPLSDVLQVIALSRSTFEQKGVKLQLSETTVLVKADQVLTLFMINTLCDNARKFTSSGGIVSIEVIEEDTYIEIQVIDTGDGLLPEEVCMINDNKIYDARSIGSGEHKGFGFGLMNCRGIINKYRKTSQFFHVCDFGVRSQHRKGSCFWFRLPRILITFLLAFFSLFSINATPLSDGVDSIRRANVQNNFEEAIQLSFEIRPLLVEPLDTVTAISFYNETAIAALFTQNWNLYKQCNAEYVRLHQLYTRDTSIEAYCIQMQKIQTDTVLLYVFLILFSLISTFLFYLLFLRPRLRSDRQFRLILQEISSFIQLTRQTLHNFQSHSSYQLQQLLERDNLESQAEIIHSRLTEQLKNQISYQQSVDDIFERIGSLYDYFLSRTHTLLVLSEEAQKVRFEEQRLYVMNQILDNCLSTIKHETMYYPARAKQLVDAILQHPNELERLYELNELLSYYKEVYVLLYQQAEHQLEQNNFKRQSISIAKCIDQFLLQSSRIMTRLSYSVQFETTLLTSSYHVFADIQLLQNLLHHLVRDYLPTTQRITLHGEPRNNLFLFNITFFCTTEVSSQTLANLFMPGYASVSHLIARQIIREHDSYLGFPGLRLYAETLDKNVFHIFFTLPIDQSSINK